MIKILVGSQNHIERERVRQDVGPDLSKSSLDEIFAGSSSVNFRNRSYSDAACMTGVTEHLLMSVPTSDFLFRYTAYKHYLDMVL